MCVSVELMFCGDLTQYEELKFWEAERTDCPCYLELIEDVSKRRYALTHSFWVELHLYRQKTEEQMSWQRAAQECPPRMFMRQCREQSTLEPRALGYITPLGG